MLTGRRLNAVMAVVALSLSAGWGQSIAHGNAPMQSGTVNMSALPPFSLAAVQERDEEEEAPSHSAVGDFPMPASRLHTQTATTSGTGTTSATAAIGAAMVAPATSFNAQISPSPAVSFQAQPMLSNAPPDTTGAASSNYVVSASNDQIVIQDRTGKILKSTNLNNFWTAGPWGTAISPAWDPNVRYDPYAQRWILVDMGAFSYSGSSMLIAVSATSDPTGNWYLYRYQAAANTTFDHPRVGFNANWIVVTGNILDDTNNLVWIHSAVYAIDKSQIYAGAASPFTQQWTAANDFTLTPALTYDNSVTTMYLLANYNGAAGSLSLSTITGPVDSPTATFDVAFPTTSNTWATTVPSSFNQNFAPQLSSSTRIGVFDARMNTVVYRNGSLWATHTVFVPASAPTISAVDWWQIGTDGTVQQFGRLQDPNGTYYYNFPSLAVNTHGDMLLGYSRMSSGTYASGGYAFRAAGDPAGTLRQEYVMGSGQGGGQNSYVHFDGNGVNRWGDYSSSAVDPVNDLDFWTVQEYAGTSGSAWGMWWDNVIAPNTTTPALQSVSANPANVTGPQSSTGTVTLNMTTPAALSVGLSTTNSAAQVPASLTVPQNASSATFPITTSPVNGATSGSITATYNGGSVFTNLTVNPPLVLQSVALNPATVIGGHLSAGTVTLTAPAPSGGVTVGLSSGNAAATVPASVVVAAGATSANFSIATAGVSSAKQVTITASYNGAAPNAILTVDPAGAVPWSVVQAQQGFNPNTGIASIPAAINTTAGNLLVAFVREGANATDNFTVTDNLGQHWTLAAYNSFGSTNRSGLFYIPNSPAVTSVTANFTTSGGVVRAGIVVYEIAGAAAASPVDAGPVTNSFATASSLTSAPLTTSNASDLLLLAVDVAGDQSGTNNSFVSGAGLAFPTTGSATDTRQAVAYAIVSSLKTNTTGSMSWGVSTGNSSSEFIAFRPDPANSTGPALQSVGLNPTTVTGGQSSTGTVTLTGAAPSGGAAVSVSSNSASAQVPSTVTVAAGSTTATFTVITSSVGSPVTAGITASYNGVNQSANLTINPLPALSSVGVNPTVVNGGQPSTGTVTLTSAAPSGGVVVNLSSSSAAATVPATVTVLAGMTTATFSVGTSSVNSPTQVTITASYNGAAPTALLTVNPPGTISLSVVQARQAFNTNKLSSVSSAISTTAGDLLVAYVREGANATDNFTVTDNLGQHWTLSGYNSFGSTNRTGLFYIPNSPAITSVTANFTTVGGVARSGIVVYEIAGAATATPVDAGPASNHFNSSRKSITSAPLSSNNANDILLFAVDLDSNQSGSNNGFVPAAGFSFPTNGAATTTRQAVSYAIVSSLQTNLTTAMSWGANAGNGSSQFIFFRAAP